MAWKTMDCGPKEVAQTIETLEGEGFKLHVIVPYVTNTGWPKFLVVGEKRGVTGPMIETT